MRVLPLALLVGLLAVSDAKVFRKCEFAELLETRYYLSRNDIKNWVCIAEFESSFNTAAINRNRNRSTDYGIFQINNKYWCGSDYGKNVCGIPCSDLMSDDITAAVRCAETVRRDTERYKGRGKGYTAWVAYNSKCKNRDLDQYMAECWSRGSNSIFPF
ncbi:lysozyme C [Penaeus monodon]|uniref:lysozyme n=1 Tax=Penaeus monodon TaxID=6687 RepID=Q8IT75_PENMO|nr:lysozyme C [Penaeus monodon]AAN16375.1 lysozyme [Penaeus monodon]ABO33316.1 hemocyte lysozyme [Penaeus monodon]ACZ63470.1 c-type lysozyme [Penaeus monodon]